jgi:hypothetical protein
MGKGPFSNAVAALQQDGMRQPGFLAQQPIKLTVMPR